MFEIDCDECGRHVLLWPNHIESLDNTDAGIVVRYRCWCGHRDELTTGRLAETRWVRHLL